MLPQVEVREPNRTVVVNFVDWCNYHGLDVEAIRANVDEKFKLDGVGLVYAQVSERNELLVKGRWAENDSLYHYLNSFIVI